LDQVGSFLSKKNLFFPFISTYSNLCIISHLQGSAKGGLGGMEASSMEAQSLAQLKSLGISLPPMPRLDGESIIINLSCLILFNDIKLLGATSTEMTD
jgi:hypothetical protein